MQDYYIFKSYNPFLNFNTEGFVHLYSTPCKLTYSAAWKRVQTLKENGILFENNGGLSFLAQNKFWSLFGIDVSKLGSQYKFIKIKISKTDWITKQQQNEALNQLFTNLLPTIQTFEIKKKIYSKHRGRACREKQNCQNTQLSISGQQFWASEISLSQREISSLLGYKSSSAGYRISEELEQGGWITIQRNLGASIQISPELGSKDFKPGYDQRLELGEWVELRKAYPNSPTYLKGLPNNHPLKKYLFLKQDARKVFYNGISLIQPTSKIFTPLI